MDGGEDEGFNGKVAVVAGGGAAGDGIGNGRAAAILLARAGARVVVVDHALALARRTVEMIAAEGGEAIAIAADLTDGKQCRAMVDEKRPAGVLRVLRALDAWLIRTPDDLYRITREYLEGAAAHTVRHAEFFWNPTGTVRDSGIAYPLAQEAILRAIADARTDYGISAHRQEREYSGVRREDLAA